MELLGAFVIVLLLIAVRLIPHVRAEARRAHRDPEPVVVDTHTIKGWSRLRYIGPR